MDLNCCVQTSDELVCMLSHPCCAHIEFCHCHSGKFGSHGEQGMGQGGDRGFLGTVLFPVPYLIKQMFHRICMQSQNKQNKEKLKEDHNYYVSLPIGSSLHHC